MKSLGLIEVESVAAAVDALDIMCKTADVEFVTGERKLGGRLVSVGSDSHYAERIGFGIPQAYEIAREAGFDFVAKFNERKVSEFPIK